MCGLFGAYCPNTITAFEAEHVRELMILNHWRGSHSTGYFSYTDRPKDNVPVRYYKSTEHPVTFAFKQWPQQEEKVWSKDRPDIIACHVRHATVGDIKKENAHPFAFKNLIGMHNGTIAGEYPKKKDFDTDSEALFSMISEKGIEEAIKATDKATSSAYAIVWLDTVNSTLNFLRNFQRPLHMIVKNGVLYWSSEAKDLRWVFEVDDKTIHPVLKEEDKFEVNKIISLPTETLVTFDITKTGFDFKTKKIDAPVKSWQKSYGNFNGIDGGAEANDFFQSNTYGRGTTSNIYPMVRDRKPFYPIRTIPQWLMLGADQEEAWRHCFALEFKKFYSISEIMHLQAYRAEYPRTFVKKFKDSWDSFNKKEQREALALLGMSRNQVKDLLNLRDVSYIYEPFYIGTDGKRVYNKEVKDYYANEKRRTLFEGEQPPDNKVIELKGPEEVSEKDLKFCIGITKTPCTEDEYIKAVDKGCVWCSDPIGMTEDIFWIDDDDFLCENCQDDAIECAGYHQMESILNLTGLQEHVSLRLKKAM